MCDAGTIRLNDSGNENGVTAPLTSGVVSCVRCDETPICFVKVWKLRNAGADSTSED